MKYYIKQLGDNDCGITSLKMLLAMTYKNKDFLYYPHGDIKRKVTLGELIKIAENEGVTLLAYRYQDKNDLFNSKKKTPMLILFKGKDGQLHMVVLKKILKKSVKIYDPATGIYKLSHQNLFKLWNGEVLEVLEARGSDFKPQKVKVYPKRFMVLSIILQIISFAALFTALLFIDPDYSFLIPVLLFTAFVVFEFLYQKVVIYCLKNFDKNVVNNDRIAELKNNFSDYYENLINYKYSLITTPVKFIGSAMILVFGLFILGINDLFNILFVGLTFLILVAFKLYEQRVWLSKKARLELIEKTLFKQKDTPIETFKRMLRELNNESYNFIGFHNFKKYFLMFITIAIVLIYLGFTGVINTNYMLFHFFMYLYLQDNFSKILDIGFDVEKIKNYKNQYLHYFG